MKILLVTEFFPTGKVLRFSGGVESRTFFVAKLLSRKHRVSIITARGLKDPKFEKISGVSVHRVGPRRSYTASVGHLFSRILYIKGAVQFGKTLDADIVDGGNYISHLIAKEIANYKKIPVVAWYPDVWINEWIKNAGLYGIFGEILERLNLIRGFDAYIAISKNTAAKLAKFTKKDINIVYCGVDKNEFTSKTGKFKTFTIICVSRLAKYKNVDILILAFSNLARKIKNVRLVIVGAGPEIKFLKGMVNNLNLNNKIDFHRNLPRKELIKFYKESHLFCLPSSVEGFGISTIEAGASGIPYVVSNIPVFKEVTKNGKGGEFFKLGDVGDLSKKLHLLISDKKLYLRKQKEAIKLAKEYSWQKAAHDTEKLYQSLVKP